MIGRVRRSERRTELRAPYRAATYRVRFGRRELDIQVARRNPSLDRLLRSLGAHTWCFITAWNPGSRPVVRWRNRAAEVRLNATVRCLGRRVFRGAGSGSAWPSEPSLFVFGVSPRRALQLGRDFRQNAVLVGCLGSLAHLLWCV